MIWIICLVLSVIMLFVSAISAFLIAKKRIGGRVVNAYNVIFAGVFLAAMIGMLPVIYYEMTEDLTYLKLVLFDFIQTAQVFTLDAGSDPIIQNITRSATGISYVYSTYMAVLFFISPLLTFGFLVSLFKNATSGLKYRCHFWGDVYIFSNLNHRSLTLAQSIKSEHKNALIVFASVNGNPDDEEELAEVARGIKAICFNKELYAIRLGVHLKRYAMYFFVIDDNESYNNRLALSVIETYGNRENTQLYVFSKGIESELLLSHSMNNAMKIRRVNELTSLIYHLLYEKGERLFDSAVQLPDGSRKITAVILGLGGYGTEMLKALTWYCQMDGYKLEIHVFDQNEAAEDRFAALCPAILDPAYNDHLEHEEGAYSITIHSGIDMTTKRFRDLFATLKDVTYGFVCLGDDEKNIDQAVKLRTLCEQNGCHPMIQAVVLDSEKKEALSGITNYRGQRYAIDFIGDLDTTYSEKIIIDNDLEQKALERHLKWGNEQEFWTYEYNYRSSMASAIHMKARIHCRIPGADKEEAMLSDQERAVIEHLEHRRWHTYVRTEGYIYSGSVENSSRNDLGKMHNDLVPFDALAEEEKRKDSSVGTK